MSLFGNNSTNTGGSAFGAAGSSGGASTTPASNTTGNLFGGAKPAGSLFGGASATPATGSLFGGGTSSTPAPAAPTGSLFGNTSNATPGAAGGSLFGGGAAKTGSLFGNAAPAAGSSSSSGTTPSLFGQKPADSGAAKPATPSLFGNTSSAPAESAAGAPAAAPGLFGKQDSAAGAAPAATGLFAKTAAATPAAPAAGGFSLGGASSTTPAAPGNLFGKPAESSGGGLFGKSAEAPAGGLFGKAAEKKDDGKIVAPSLFGSSAPKTDDKADGDAKAVASSSTKPEVAVPPPSMLRGQTIEEIVNRWTSELETHVKDFTKFAGEVVVWDRALIENGNNIAALYSHVLAAERQQNEIDQTLDHVEQQQKDLLSTLDAYEKVSQELLGGQGGGLRSLDTGPADTERDKNYLLATDLHTNLDDLSSSLTQMIDSVNALSTAQKPNEGTEDPMAQISQVLSSHLESLQWIDTAARELDGKVGEVERRVKESGHSYGGSQKGRGGFGLNR